VNALFRLGQYSSKAKDAEAFWMSIREALQPYEHDFPTAILYSHCETDVASGSSSPQRNTTCSLEWKIGYAAKHDDIPEALDFEDDNALAKAMSDSAKTGVATLYRHEDGELPDALYTDIEKRGFGDPVKAMLVIPVRTSNESTTGYIIMGLNTRRPYDAEYQEFLVVFTNFLSTSAASVALHEEEVRNRKRQEEQAARDREALSAEVACLAQEASVVAGKLQNLHDIANAVGLGYFEFGINGQLLHANVRMRLFLRETS
jgi:GAF domain-containing protein